MGDRGESRIQREAGKADADVGVTTEITLEVVELFPILGHRLRGRMGVDAVIEDFGVVEDSARPEDPRQLPHRQ